MHDTTSQHQKFVAAFFCIAEAAKERTLTVKDIYPRFELDRVFDEQFIFRLGFPKQNENTTFVKDFVEKYPESFVLVNSPGITISELQNLVKENLNKKTIILEGFSSENVTDFLYLIKRSFKKENILDEALKCSSIIIID